MNFPKKSVVIFCFYFLFLLSLKKSHSQHFHSFEYLNGFQLHYKFSFWFTNNAANAYLEIKKIDEKHFIAKLTGETTGVIGFLASYRKDIMISNCVYNPKLKRFIPIKFIKKIIIGKNIRESEYIFDYNKMEIIKNRTKIKYEQIDDEDDPFAERKIEKHYHYQIPLLKYPVDDYLTATMNFLTGVYGVPSKEKPIIVDIFPESNKKKRNRKIKIFLINKGDNFYKIFIDLNVDFISDKIKKAYGILDKNMIPIKVDIPTGTIIGTIKVKKVNFNEK